MQNQSGRFTGKTALSKIGNALLRKALFMPASVALRFCAPIKLWAQQILSRRPELTKLQIRGAVMHKLIRIIFGVLKHQSPLIPTLPLPSIQLDTKDRILALNVVGALLGRRLDARWENVESILYPDALNEAYIIR